eukprot:6188371-Pleurochrysis_carterae.AAC.9
MLSHRMHRDARGTLWPGVGQHLDFKKRCAWLPTSTKLRVGRFVALESLLGSLGTGEKCLALPQRHASLAYWSTLISAIQLTYSRSVCMSSPMHLCTRASLQERVSLTCSTTGTATICVSSLAESPVVSSPAA